MDTQPLSLHDDRITVVGNTVTFWFSKTSTASVTLDASAAATIESRNLKKAAINCVTHAVEFRNDSDHAVVTCTVSEDQASDVCAKNARARYERKTEVTGAGL